MPPNRPHLILLMTDQQKVSATGCYGNSLVRTPTWDRLATEGVLFENCFAQSPICTPSRTSLMTGTYPPVHQVFCHQNYAPPNLPQLAELLAQAGYYCLTAGHYESDRGLDRGWHDHIEMCGTPELQAALRAQYGAGAREHGWSAGTHERPPAQAHAAQLTDAVIQRLEALDPEAAPLFLQVAYIEPHPPYFAPRGTLDPERLRAWPQPPRGTPEQRPAWHQRALANYRSADATSEDIQRLLEAYHAMTEYADNQMGRLLAALERKGILDNAWVVACSDHGDYAGEKGFFTKTETPYRCLLQVPLVIRGPAGIWPAGRRIAPLVELLDLFPTLLALGGAEPAAQAQGHDLTDWVQQGARSDLREVSFAAVGEYHGPLRTTMPWGLPHAGRHPSLVCGARHTRFSYVADPDYGDEAYDLVRDPFELAPLPLDAPVAEVQQLRAALAAWHADCERLRKTLNVQPGIRNFEQLPPSTLTAPVP